jgi:hypothetical protein
VENLQPEVAGVAVAVTILVNLDKGRQSGAKERQRQVRVGRGQVLLAVERDRVMGMQYILMPKPGHPQVEL